MLKKKTKKKTKDRDPGRLQGGPALGAVAAGRDEPAEELPTYIYIYIYIYVYIYIYRERERYIYRDIDR